MENSRSTLGTSKEEVNILYPRDLSVIFTILNNIKGTGTTTPAVNPVRCASVFTPGWCARNSSGLCM